MPQPYTLPLTAAEIEDALISSRKQNITVSALVEYINTLSPKPTEDKVYVTGGRTELGDAPQRLWVVKSGSRDQNFGTIWTVDSSYYIEMLNWDGDVRDFATEGDAEAYAYSVEHDQNVQKYEGPRTITNVDVKSGGITNEGLYNGYTPMQNDLSNLSGDGVEYSHLSQELQDTISVGFDPANYLGTWDPTTNTVKFNGVSVGAIPPPSDPYWSSGARYKFSSNWDSTNESYDDTSHLRLASTISLSGDFEMGFSVHLVHADITGVDTSNGSEVLFYGGSSANFIRIRSAGALVNKGLGIKFGGSEHVVSASNINFQLNQTYKFRIVRSGSTMTVYVNDEQVQTFSGVTGTFDITQIGGYDVNFPAYFFRNSIFDIYINTLSEEHTYTLYGDDPWDDKGSGPANNLTPYSGGLSGDGSGLLNSPSGLLNFSLIYQTTRSNVGDWYYIETSGTASGTNADGTYSAGDYLVVTEEGYASKPNQTYLVDGSVTQQKLASGLSSSVTTSLVRSQKIPSIFYNGNLKNLGSGVKKRFGNNQPFVSTSVPELNALGMEDMLNVASHTGNKYVALELPEDFWKQMQPDGYLGQTFYVYCANGFTADTVLKTPAFFYEKNSDPDNGTTVESATATSVYGSGYIELSSNLRLYYGFCKLKTISDRVYRLLFGYAGQSGTTVESYLVGGFGLFYSHDQAISSINDLDYENFHSAEGGFDALRWHKEVGEFYDLDQDITSLQSSVSTAQSDITTLESDVQTLENTVDTLSGVSLINDSLKLSNSDMITVHGDSYTASSYTPKGKHYVGKICNLSDWRLDPFLAVSGHTTMNQMEDLLNSSDLEQLSPTYSIIITYTNDIKFSSEEEITQDMENMIQAIFSLGSIPILATEYHMSGGSGMFMAYKRLGQKYNIPVFNILPDSTVLRADTFPDSPTTSGDYSQFWQGTHAGVRTNELFANPLTELINQLPRPTKSLRLFRIRNEVVVTGLDDLRYRSLESRCELFKEIHGGHRHLSQEKYYDALDVNSSSTAQESEYNRLIDNNAVSFEDYALVEAILPYNIATTSNLKLKLTSSSTLQVYVLDTKAAPYAAGAKSTGFYTSSNPNVTVGDQYTYNGKTYEVLDVFQDNVRGLEATDNWVIAANNLSITYGNYDRNDKTTTDGVLSFSSGNSGSPSSISFTQIREAFDEYWYTNYGKPQGHWVEVSETGTTGEFLVGSDLSGLVNRDKVAFLIKKTGSFSLTDIEVTWASSRISKVNKALTLDDYKLPVGEGTSYLSTALTTSGNIAWDSHAGATVVAKSNLVDQVVPVGVTEVVELDTNDYIQTQLDIGDTDLRVEKPFLIEIWARRFPPVYDHTSTSYPTDAPITEDTFDYGKLAVELYTRDKNSSGGAVRPATVESVELVPLHYSAIRIKTTMPANTRDVRLTLKALSDDIQIAKVMVNEYN